MKKELVHRDLRDGKEPACEGQDKGYAKAKTMKPRLSCSGSSRLPGVTGAGAFREDQETRRRTRKAVVRR